MSLGWALTQHDCVLIRRGHLDTDKIQKKDHVRTRREAAPTAKEGGLRETSAANTLTSDFQPPKL